MVKILRNGLERQIISVSNTVMQISFGGRHIKVLVNSCQVIEVEHGHSEQTTDERQGVSIYILKNSIKTTTLSLPIIVQ